MSPILAPILAVYFLQEEYLYPWKQQTIKIGGDDDRTRAKLTAQLESKIGPASPSPDGLSVPMDSRVLYDCNRRPFCFRSEFNNIHIRLGLSDPANVDRRISFLLRR